MVFVTCPRSVQTARLPAAPSLVLQSWPRMLPLIRHMASGVFTCPRSMQTARCLLLAAPSLVLQSWPQMLPLPRHVASSPNRLSADKGKWETQACVGVDV